MIFCFPSDSPYIDLEEDDDGKKQGKKVRQEIKRARGGFLVDHENRGEEEQRLYDKANLKSLLI